jgi:uncharacterized protein YjbJ (UPF0337 family)
MTDKNIDKAKGRVKQAAGALSGDKRLKNETVDKVADTLTGRKRRKG